MTTGSVTIHLNPETHNALRVAAQREQTSRSAIARRAIIAYLVDTTTKAPND